MAPTTQQQDFMVFLKSTKNTMPVCPIISACGTVTCNAAKFISKSLQNYYGRTSSFVSINGEEETLISFDNSAVFARIPVPVALQVINSKISTCTNFTSVYKIPAEKFISFWNSLSTTVSSASTRNFTNSYKVQP